MSSSDDHRLLSLIGSSSSDDIFTSLSDYLHPLTSRKQDKLRSLAKKFLPFLNKSISLFPKRLSNPQPHDSSPAGDLFFAYELCLDCLESFFSQLACKPHTLQLQRSPNFPNIPQEQDQVVVLSCLLRKIDNLESSLNKFASFHDHKRRDRHFSTVKDSAARVIQTHFRSYLVYRSIFFRHLKELAMIKSSFLSLKSSVSGKPIFSFKVVSLKATDFLLQLDSIQGRVDPMIRSSKRSLSRDLVRILQYVDDCVVRRRGLGPRRRRTNLVAEKKKC
ncbi:unnamed protein product [Eruca vesicaria subsp. sativa]|uniref:Separase-like TPR repeats region domain-containing protein n=1 Tax=Eruca vesicaria subsp. sativa TaxID=29727 RepID=A0ABC8IZ39_ERUVS|nr:unnamed protein product [Eruca vesicaria subsp. sativa]